MKEAGFGKAVFEYMKDHRDHIEVDLEELFELAFQHGMCWKVPYDPNVHGEEDLEPGDMMFRFK